jgi:hypothetical protein
MDYKYLKYKLKYLNIKKFFNIYGGGLEDNIKILNSELYNSEFMYTFIPEVYYSKHPIFPNLYMICEKLVDSSEFGENGLDREFIQKRTKQDLKNLEEDNTRFDFSIRWFNYKYFHRISSIYSITKTDEYNVYISYIVDLQDYDGDELEKIKTWIEKPVVDIKKLIIQKYLWIRKSTSNIPVAIHFFIRNRQEMDKLTPKWGLDEITIKKDSFGDDIEISKYPHQSIILHGFSACVLKKFFTHIQFVWSSPNNSMYNIFKNMLKLLDKPEDILHDNTLSSIDVSDIRYKLYLASGNNILISLDNLIMIANVFIANALKEKIAIEETTKEATTEEKR